MTIRLRLITLPIFLVGALQLGGCGRKEIKPPPPGGAYLSTSAGASFDQSVQIIGKPGEYIANFPLRQIFRAPHDTSLIIIAAGPQGIVRSKDDGQSWATIPTPLAVATDALALDTGVLVVSGTDGEGQGFVIRSLDDGQSWQSVYTVPIPESQKKKSFQIVGETQQQTSFVMDLELDPFNSDRIYGASNLGTIVVGSGSAKVWSNLYTFRETAFNPVGNGTIGLRKFVPSPHTPGEVALITDQKEVIRINPAGQEIIKVPQYITTPPPFGAGLGQKDVLDLTFVPGFPDALIIGVEDGVVVTRDNGATWIQLPVPIEDTQKFQSVVVAVSPTNVNRILVGIGHVFYRSEDGGLSWNTYALGLPTHRVYDISINPQNAAKVLAVVIPEQI